MMKREPDYTIRLPWSPSVNGYWRAIGRAQKISKRGRVFRERAMFAITEQGLYGIKLKDRLVAKITLHAPTRARRDIDNFLKAPLDALSHSKVYLDDSQIDRLLVIRGEVVRGGLIVIDLWRL